MLDTKVEKLIKFIEDTTGAEIFSVGGSVRDELLNREVKDLDFLVRFLHVEDLIVALEEFGKVDQVGAKFGVVRLVPFDRSLIEMEFALPRKEMSIGSGHNDFVVKFDPFIPVEEDLFRRDFTINAIARRVTTGKVIDPFNGTEDIDNGVIRFVSPESAKEDPLRMLRGIRFMSKLGFVIDEKTEDQMIMASHLLKTVSVERIKDELEKIVVGISAGAALLLAKDLHLLDDILPEITDSHIDRMAFTATTDPDVKFATLFSSNSEKIAKRLRFSNNSIRRIAVLASVSLTSASNDVSARMALAALRKAPGSLRDNAIAVAAIRRNHDEAHRMINELRKNPPLGVADLAIDGNDLLNIGLKGREIGEMLDRMVRMVICFPEKNTFGELIDFAKDETVFVSV